MDLKLMATRLCQQTPTPRCRCVNESTKLLTTNGDTVDTTGEHQAAAQQKCDFRTNATKTWSLKDCLALGMAALEGALVRGRSLNLQVVWEASVATHCLYPANGCY